MPLPAELSYRRFRRLFALWSTKTSGKPRSWFCLCICGRFITVTTRHLTQGDTKSCGCLAIDGRRKRVKLLAATHKHENRQCARCGKRFTTDHSRHVYCSRVCLDLAMSRVVTIAKHCGNCGRMIPAAKKCQFYCDGECRRQAALRRRAKAVPTRACGHCGEVFLHGGTRTRYCSERCRKARIYQKHSARIRPSFEQQFAIIAAKLEARGNDDQSQGD